MIQSHYQGRILKKLDRGFKGQLGGLGKYDFFEAHLIPIKAPQAKKNQIVTALLAN